MERIVEENINTVEYWNNRHATEPRHVWEPADIISKISKLIPRDKSLLDVGVGGGLICGRLQATRSDLTYYGCDFSKESISKLRTNPHVHFTDLFVWDVRTPPVPLMQFDIVLATELLEHLDSPALAVAHMAEVAREMVIVTVPNRNAVTSPEHVWSYTPEDIAILLNPFGNVTVEVVRWEGFNILGAVCKL